MSQPLRIGAQIGPADPFSVQVRDAVRQQAQRCGIDLTSITVDLSTLPHPHHAALVEELLAQELDALGEPLSAG